MLNRGRVLNRGRGELSLIVHISGRALKPQRFGQNTILAKQPCLEFRRRRPGEIWREQHSLQPAVVDSSRKFKDCVLEMRTLVRKSVCKCEPSARKCPRDLAQARSKECEPFVRNPTQNVNPLLEIQCWSSIFHHQNFLKHEECHRKGARNAKPHSENA